MNDESKFTVEIWQSWLGPFQAVRSLMEAGLENREQAVNWLKGRLRSGELCAGGWFLKLDDDDPKK
ncbi:MAG TPA: hypothetical protein VGN36_03755, partial [Sphingorhabdus sp.]|nr:hypothetical protein [Sphingorhabdus sp.]